MIHDQRIESPRSGLSSPKRRSSLSSPPSISELTERQLSLFNLNASASHSINQPIEEHESDYDEDQIDVIFSHIQSVSQSISSQLAEIGAQTQARAYEVS